VRKTNFYTAEQLEQIAVFDWIRLHPEIAKIAFHVPNEGRRSLFTGNLLKKMGLLAGVSDIIVLKAAHGYHGLCIELKAKDSNGKFGRPTKAQMDFIDAVCEQNYYATVCNGAFEAIEVLEWYLKDGKK